MPAHRAAAEGTLNPDCPRSQLAHLVRNHRFRADQATGTSERGEAGKCLLTMTRRRVDTVNCVSLQLRCNRLIEWLNQSESG